MPDLDFTGERFVTSHTSPQICYEHWHRYLFSTQFIAGKKVLDCACGEGYGSFLLSQYAHSVIGIDISHEAIAYAQEKYPQKNLEFKTGSVAAIPLKTDHTFDVVISFETIEHVSGEVQHAFLKEVKRLLKPGGLFLVSTPNKKVYSDDPLYKNEYHLREFYPDEFKTFLHTGFSHIRLLGQRVAPVSYLWDLEHPVAAYQEFRLDFTQAAFVPTQAPLHEVYDIALCSDQEINLPTNTSALLDISDQWSASHQQQLNQLGQSVYEKEQTIKQLAAHLRTRDAVIYRLENQTRLQALPQNAVSIVIPVFNQVDYTRQCIECLSQTTPPELYNGIIVDNASTDRTPELLKQLAGDVTLVTNRENLGFVIACNQGAEKSQSKYLLFLNNDTEPQAGWLEEMLLLMEGDATIGAAGGKLVYPNGRLQEAGGIIFSDGHGWNFGRHDDPQKEIYNQTIEVDYCSGACLLVRQDLFTQLNGFDTRYVPAYYEDVDLCFGIRALGYKVVYCPQAVVLHYEGITAGTDLKSGLKSYQVKNRDAFLEKWQSVLSRHETNPNLSGKIPASADRQKRGLKTINSPAKTANTTDHPHILVIDPLLPAYDRSAGAMRLFNILKIMREQHYPITYIARNGIRQESYKRELEAMGITVFATDPDKMASLGHPVTAARISLETILRETFFAIAWLSFYEIAEQYLPEIRQYSPNTQILIDTVDVHFLRETRQAEILQDTALRKKAKETQNRELAIYAKADTLIMVTPADATIVHNHLPGKETLIIPLIHETLPDFPEFMQRQGLVFVANFNHPPNADAMHFFCRDVLPKIKKTIPDISMTIVGANPPENIRQLAGPGIKVTGYVLETAPYLDAARVSVAPLRFGAGMKGKVCEALSRGLPVVTTAIGCEGIGLTHEQNVMQADTAQTFADAVVRLYTDETLWTKLAHQGRDFLETHYSYRTIAAQMASQLPDMSAHNNVHAELVSIIILTHNQLTYTQKCIESIFRHTRSPYELLFVDNCSTDKTLDYLGKLQAPDTCQRIHIIKNTENAGFAKGNNQGISQAKGPLLLLMNNDIVVTPDWLEKLRRTLKHDPNIGIVGPMTNYASAPQHVPKPEYHLDSLEGLDAFSTSYGAEHTGQAHPYWRLVGFCMLMKRDVIDTIGGLDHRFGLGNFEDDDFTLRAAIAGFSSWIAEDCYVHHFGSRTFVDTKIDYQASLRQNWEIFKRKWRIPSDLPYGYTYSMKKTIKNGLKQEHFCPLV
ncbi:glycosyltransferase [bacterium]|nr:glycosyltransferase [bacterium]